MLKAKLADVINLKRPGNIDSKHSLNSLKLDGKKIKEERLRNNFKVRDLAPVLGLSESVIYGIENENIRVSATVAQTIAKWFEIDLDLLIKGGRKLIENSQLAIVKSPTEVNSPIISSKTPRQKRNRATLALNGFKVRDCRVRKQLDTRMVARDSGISLGYLNQIETNRIDSISVGAATLIAKSLNVSLKDILKNPDDAIAFEHSVSIPQKAPQIETSIIGISIPASLTKIAMERGIEYDDVEAIFAAHAVLSGNSQKQMNEMYWDLFVTLRIHSEK